MRGSTADLLSLPIGDALRLLDLVRNSYK
jgi:hypothetical protein